MKRNILHIIASLAVLLFAFAACSTKKNTSGTRFYHAMTARFNTYFNGSEAFKEGVFAQQDGHKDNYTELLPIFNVRDKKTAGIGKSNFETAIEKCEKAIKQHSIKAKPKTNVNKRKTAEDKAYLARKEFNPFLRHAWLLMGKAQFQQGDFIEAASTFNYICSLYAGQPEVVSVARAYLARCYVELEWPYDAEDALRRIRRDSIEGDGEKEYNASYADYLILVEQYKEAIPYLQSTIKKERNKQQRARLNYLLGQLYHETGNDAEAYKALRRVIRANPTYELSFSAQILQTEVMAEGNHNKVVKKLKRMARNKKNKDYQDQIYYALGNIYLANKDTAHCIGAYEKGKKALDEVSEVIDLIEETEEEDLVPELDALLNTAEEDLEDMRIRSLLRGKYDGYNALLTLHSGAGGTESCDWVSMLYRMYTRYAEKSGFKVTELDRLDGDEAGIKSVDFKIEGENAYGYLKAEKGVHRLVRISPFDANKRRHTSFASLEVMPEIEDDGDVEIRSEDLKVTTFRSSGAGGQHINKTESAIRIQHIPTGIVVSCQNERSQIQNREMAMKMLRSKLIELKESERLANEQNLKGEIKKIEWGSQIRSYVFCPYTLVKDHRTGCETGNIQAVMDGDIQPFIIDYLKKS